jgi:murein DD-endopeptidase MepM/ murein hydrolase activator NlpD
MEYTVRFAHLKNLPNFQEGDIIHEGMFIGRMGSSGESIHNHLHIDVVEGSVDKLIRLKEIGYEPEKFYIPNIRQLNYFIGEKLFKFKVVITTHFYDPEYKIKRKKDHPGYDVVPQDRHRRKKHFNIFWNRSKKGTVLKVGYDEKGYGNYILIGYEA